MRTNTPPSQTPDTGLIKPPDPDKLQQSFLKTIFSRKMLVALLMGFSCGLPLLLTVSVLQAWMKEEGVDLTLIGMMALVGLPYTLKFLWAPFLDRYTLPFFGRRRGWLLVAQVALAVSIARLGQTEPANNELSLCIGVLDLPPEVRFLPNAGHLGPRIVGEIRG